MKADLAARCCAALLALRAAVGAAAIRQRPQAEACSGIVARNESLISPLPVESLLAAFGQDKSRYFGYLKEAGIDKGGVEMSVPQKLPTTCLGDAHFVFVGDSMARMSYEAFVRLGGHSVSVESMAELRRMEEDAKFSPLQYWTKTASDNFFLQDSRVPASYLIYLAKRPSVVERDLREVVERIRSSTPDAKLVFWFDAFLHAWQLGERGWADPGQRMSWQLELHNLVESIAPGSLFVWDSPPLVDLPLMRAKPAWAQARIFEEARAPQLTSMFAEGDRHVMARLGAPMTMRWEISKRYRGLTCDGLHAYTLRRLGGHAWNCTGFPAYEDLVLQTGLQQLCLGGPAVPLCP